MYLWISVLRVVAVFGDRINCRLSIQWWLVASARKLNSRFETAPTAKLQGRQMHVQMHGSTHLKF